MCVCVCVVTKQCTLSTTPTVTRMVRFTLTTGHHGIAFSCQFVLSCLSAEQPIVDIDSVASALLYAISTIQKACSIIQ